MNWRVLLEQVEARAWQAFRPQVVALPFTTLYERSVDWPPDESADELLATSLNRAKEHGCNFFTEGTEYNRIETPEAWFTEGKSENNVRMTPQC